MAACLLILQYVLFETSYDKFLKNVDDIYRVRLDRIYPDRHDKSAGVTAAVGPTLKDEFIEVEDFTKLWGTKHLNNIISFGDKIFREEGLYFADSSFFNLFSYKLLKGNASTALAEPHRMVITQSIAKKYFGEADPVGKYLNYSNAWESDDFLVTGVLPNVPENTHLKFDILVSFKTLSQYTEGQSQSSWGWNAFLTYLKLSTGSNPVEFERKLRPFIDKYYADRIAQGIGVDLILQPITDIHLKSNLRFEPEENSNSRSVYFLMIIAIFIVVIAWVNYTNLSTAKSLERAREVGIRKVSGARKFELVSQYLLESILFNLIGLVIAVTIVQLSMPWFEAFNGKKIEIDFWTNPFSITIIIVTVVIGAICSGLYPAIILSSFTPSQVLKSKSIKRIKGINLRKSLIIIQFSISVFLIAGTYTVYKQLTFMRNQDLGININETLVIRGPGAQDSTYKQRLESFKLNVKNLAAVQQVTNSTMVPGKEIGWINNSVRAENEPEALHSMPFIGVQDDFIDAFNLKIIAGRNFDRHRIGEVDNVVLTRSAAKLLGFDVPESGIGETILDSGRKYQVIGVVEDYHQRSLNNKYDPIIFRYVPDAASFYSIKLNTNNLQESIASLESQWKLSFPGRPFDYFFLDDFFDQQYKADQQFGQVFGLFAGLAIMIACLGLYGLSAFITSQRTKEIGVRKVLGASTVAILYLLIKDFIVLVLIASVIAIPLSYFGFENWLNNYVFRIQMGWWFAIVPLSIVLLITLITAGWQTTKATFANPVDSLRYE